MLEILILVLVILLIFLVKELKKNRQYFNDLEKTIVATGKEIDENLDDLENTVIGYKKKC